MNNTNFGIDYRINIDNCYFEPIYDEIVEIAYIKALDTLFENGKYCDFSDINLTRKEVH